ncbi:GntT/GntP/DsdX family permease, partial [Agathobaculum sp. LCP25S3_E8]|uniref:GntT/GntP/DsdX family permease n=1 Tax=Agathobaculum sp. LCP25S3_E8 TaxID=3438735 RepID=UPI003F91BA36
MATYWSVIVFLIALAYLLFTIMKLKMNPFFSMMSGAVIAGILVRMSPTDIVSSISTGFGGILGSLGIVIWSDTIKPHTQGGIMKNRKGVEDGTEIQCRIQGRRAEI